MLNFLQSLDAGVVVVLSRAVQEWPPLAEFLASVARYSTAGCIFLAGIYWFWFHRSGRIEFRRRVIINMVPAVFFALTLNRSISVWLPFRVRPMYDLALGFRPSDAAPALNLENWSSFPSDTATYFFVMVAAIWMMSRRAGIVYAIFALVFVAFLRVSLGTHYPTDILAGAVLGIVSMWVVDRVLANHLARRLLRFQEHAPHWFAAIGFLVAYELALTLQDIRNLQHGLLVNAHRAVQAWLTAIPSPMRVIASIVAVGLFSLGALVICRLWRQRWTADVGTAQIAKRASE